MDNSVVRSLNEELLADEYIYAFVVVRMFEQTGLFPGVLDEINQFISRECGSEDYFDNGQPKSACIAAK